MQSFAWSDMRLTISSADHGASRRWPIVDEHCDVIAGLDWIKAEWCPREDDVAQLEGEAKLGEMASQPIE